MKFRVLCLCFVIAISLVSCNETKDNVSDDRQSVFEYITSGNVEAIKKLVEKYGPEIITRDFGNGPALLAWAAAYNQTDIIKYLLAQGADPNYSSESGYSPLLNAAFSGGIESVKLLVEHGARVNDAAEDGKTAYIVAASANKFDVCKFLLSKGADGTAKTRGGLDALSEAMCGSDKIRVSNVRFLVENGADPNRKIYCGEPTTPLMMAAKEMRNKEIYDYLISVGADPSWKDDEGKTAAHYLDNTQ